MSYGLLHVSVGNKLLKYVPLCQRTYGYPLTAQLEN